MAYASRNWKATESTDLIGSKYTLAVTGEVQVLKSNEEPHLAKARPQGISPATLLLDLSVTGAGDIGGEIVVWKPVEYVHEISSGEYTHVTVRGETDEHSIKVEEILS